MPGSRQSIDFRSSIFQILTDLIYFSFKINKLNKELNKKLNKLKLKIELLNEIINLKTIYKIRHY